LGIEGFKSENFRGLGLEAAGIWSPG